MIRKKLSVKNYQVIVNPRMPGHVIEFSDAHLDINREYFNEKYKPELMIDLATLTGAIIVALGDRYAGLFSNNDSLANKILQASKETGELSWRLPMDEEFDKLLNCQIADIKNITGTRGAGSITAAQFLKRFVGKTSWAHLDIAGVTWSKKGSSFARSGGTGFGVKLLDEFVRKNYE